MKLIYENYRKGSLKRNQTLLEMGNFTKEELELLEYFQFNEGVVQMGTNLLVGMKDFYNRVKELGKEQILKFIKKMGKAYRDFVQKLRQRKILKKGQARNEYIAIDLLLTKKHSGLALAIFGAIFKIVGGYAVEKLFKAPEIFKKVQDIMTAVRGGDFAAALKDMFGDIEDLAEIIQQAIEFQKDNKNIDAITGMGHNVPGVGDLRAIEERFIKHIGVPK